MRSRVVVLVPLALALLSACSAEPPPEDAQRIDAETRIEIAGARPPEPQVVADGESDAPVVAKPAANGSGAREIEWDSLIPDDYRPDKLLAEFNIDELSDDDPRAAELMQKLQALWDTAPVRDDLDGAEIRLPGFVVPVEGDARETTGFLLVPYYGACIHVPPPPANQTVYVLTEQGEGANPGLFDVVWVTGTMSVKRTETDLAEAGYTLYASDVEPYE